MTRQTEPEMVKRLAACSARVGRAEARLDAERAHRDAAIRAAHRDGYSLRSIAEAAGVSYAWVRKACGLPT